MSDINVTAYETAPSLVNKFLNSDGSVTDMDGNVILEADSSRAKAWELAKSLPTIPNKWLDADGTIKTFEEIGGGGTSIVGQNILITPSTETQTITPEEGYNAILQVTVNSVDNTIDDNIVAENIKEDVSILGVTGSLNFTSYDEYDTALETSKEILNIGSEE